MDPPLLAAGARLLHVLWHARLLSTIEADDWRVANSPWAHAAWRCSLVLGCCCLSVVVGGLGALAVAVGGLGGARARVVS